MQTPPGQALEHCEWLTDMTYEPTESGNDRDRLIRVEERLKHMDENQGRALRELKDAIVDLASDSKNELVETRSRLLDLEKRVDKIYWLWGVAMVVWPPIMMLLLKFLSARFGL